MNSHILRFRANPISKTDVNTISNKTNKSPNHKIANKHFTITFARTYSSSKSASQARTVCVCKFLGAFAYELTIETKHEWTHSHCFRIQLMCQSVPSVGIIYCLLLFVLCVCMPGMRLHQCFNRQPYFSRVSNIRQSRLFVSALTDAFFRLWMDDGITFWTEHRLVVSDFCQLSSKLVHDGQFGCNKIC